MNRNVDSYWCVGTAAVLMVRQVLIGSLTLTVSSHIRCKEVVSLYPEAYKCVCAEHGISILSLNLAVVFSLYLHTKLLPNSPAFRVTMCFCFKMTKNELSPSLLKAQWSVSSYCVICYVDIHKCRKVESHFHCAHTNTEEYIGCSKTERKLQRKTN